MVSGVTDRHKTGMSAKRLRKSNNNGALIEILAARRKSSVLRWAFGHQLIIVAR